MASYVPFPDPLAVPENGGYQVTAPRKVIARLLEEKREGFSAEAPIGELPSVGRATVNRAINLFPEAGVVCKLPTFTAPAAMATTTPRCASNGAQWMNSARRRSNG